MHYYTNGSDVIVSANGAGDYYTQDVTIGPDGLARIAYQNAHGHGADFIRCTDASCGARSTSEITYSGQYAYDVSIAVGADGKALIGGGSSTGVSAYLDYIRCRTADCPSYSEQVLSGSWTNGSLNLGLDGNFSIIAADSQSLLQPRPQDQFYRL